MNSNRTLLATLASALFAAVSTGQDDAGVFELAPFTVVPDGAQSVFQVTARDLSQRQASDLEDALSIDPSVTVGGSTGVAQKIYVRNLGEGLLNVSVDGATQSGSLFHHIGRVAIEPELLKQVEVQPGVGNATDGPGALGGAIRFVTKDPTDFLLPDETAGALLKYGYFSNTRGHKASATGFARLGEDWSALASAVVSEHEEIEDGDGNRLAGSDTRQEVGLAKIAGFFGDGQSLRLSVEQIDESGDKLRRPEWAPGPGNPVFPMESNRQTAALRYGFRPSEAEWLDLQLNASATRADVFQDAVWGPYEGEISSRQFDLRNTQRFSGHELVYGLDHRRDEVTAGPSDAPETYSENARVTGLFIQDNYQITEALSLDAGARFDMYRLRDQQDQEFEHEGFSPNLGATYRFDERFSVAASYATAFRGPNINDAFRIDIATNSPDLEAETARNYELRFSYRQEAIQLEAGVYRNRIEDVITNTLPWSSVYVNAGELETDGFFARAAYGNERVNFSLQYNNADTTLNGQTATRYQYSSLVSRIGNTWVADAYWRPFAQLDLGWNARLVERVDDILVPEAITGLPGSFIDKPSYLTHDLYLRWTPAFSDALTFNLTLKNVFDERYISHGSIEDMTAFPDFDGVVGAAEAGRDARLSVSLRF